MSELSSEPGKRRSRLTQIVANCFALEQSIKQRKSVHSNRDKTMKFENNSNTARALVSVICVLLMGCGKPENVIFGDRPLETLSASASILKDVPEQDRKLVAEYLTVLSKGEPTITNDPPASGRTFGEVLTSARTWKKAEEEDAKTYGGICRRYGLAIAAVATARDNMDTPRFSEIVSKHPVLQETSTNARALIWAMAINLKSANVSDSPAALKNKAYDACLNSNLYFGNAYSAQR